ncbi:MAG: hypothetical protein H6780_00270 [Candidatus Nomurabacteria bacterium]|nr:MAG: hypothetical protein H6780_00270 [Candidatus Nomurabacteria bacterium]
MKDQQEKPVKTQEQIGKEVKRHRNFQASVVALITIFIIGKIFPLGVLGYVIGTLLLQRFFFAIDIVEAIKRNNPDIGPKRQSKNGGNSVDGNGSDEPRTQSKVFKYLFIFIGVWALIGLVISFFDAVSGT